MCDEFILPLTVVLEEGVNLESFQHCIPHLSASSGVIICSKQNILCGHVNQFNFFMSLMSGPQTFLSSHSCEFKKYILLRFV